VRGGWVRLLRQRPSVPPGGRQGGADHWLPRFIGRYRGATAATVARAGIDQGPGERPDRIDPLRRSNGSGRWKFGRPGGRSFREQGDLFKGRRSSVICALGDQPRSQV